MDTDTNDGGKDGGRTEAARTDPAAHREDSQMVDLAQNNQGSVAAALDDNMEAQITEAGAKGEVMEDEDEEPKMQRVADLTWEGK